MNYYRPIKEIFNFEKGSLQSSKAIDGEYNFITASSEWKKHNTYEHDKEALIIAIAASGSLGRVHYINGKFISSDLCFILTPKDQKKIPVDLQFYQHLFQFIRQDLVQATATGTSKLAINQENFGNYKVPYFDIDHQKKYRKKFVKLEEQQFLFKSQINNQKTNLKNLRKQILQDAIEGKLTKEWREQNPDIEPASELLKKIKKEKENLIAEKKIKKEKPLPPIDKNKIPFELPKSWVWTRIGEITNYGSSEKIEPNRITDNTWILDLEDIEKESSKIINFETFKNRNTTSSKSVFKKGDVLYSKLRPYLDKVVVAPGDGICTTEIIPIKMYAELNSLFFMYNLKRRDFLDYASRCVKGMKMPRFGTEDVKLSYFPLPPLSEQLAIVSKLETLMQKLDEAEKQIDKSLEVSKLLTKSILTEAFKNEG